MGETEASQAEAPGLGRGGRGKHSGASAAPQAPGAQLPPWTTAPVSAAGARCPVLWGGAVPCPPSCQTQLCPGLARGSQEQPDQQSPGGDRPPASPSRDPRARSPRRGYLGAWVTCRTAGLGEEASSLLAGAVCSRPHGRGCGLSEGGGSWAGASRPGGGHSHAWFPAACRPRLTRAWPLLPPRRPVGLRPPALGLPPASPSPMAQPTPRAPGPRRRHSRARGRDSPPSELPAPRVAPMWPPRPRAPSQVCPRGQHTALGRSAQPLQACWGGDFSLFKLAT